MTDIQAIRERHEKCESDFTSGNVMPMHIYMSAARQDRATLLSALTAAEARAEAAEARVKELEKALTWFLDDPRFQVAVGGNPDVVERMITEASRTLKGTPDGR